MATACSVLDSAARSARDYFWPSEEASRDSNDHIRQQWG